MHGTTTVDEPKAEPQPRPDRPRRGRWLRGLTGSLALGLGVLATFLVAAQFYAIHNGSIGPGWEVVFGHLAGATVAVVAQRVFDRRRGAFGWLGALVVVAITAAVLWLGWYR
ncbi:hypothetical protein GCM10012275_11780 [Longimycelium tulufanense]|uniref:Uncharacterized protein n=1 Tax=Longimycelium tulufanense TaxID=907463 RepID=A0A8J3FTP0_9PSEU|nr:hypothetical protein [Longimycelium tulufanense]GGM42435.1 hypothetical protein GCM10012275_11780 [Longimycelium tulufanense]